MSLDEPGRLIEAMLGAPDRLGYRGAVLAAMGGGHMPERMTEIAVTPCRGDADRGLAARRRRADAATDLRRAECRRSRCARRA